MKNKFVQFSLDDQKKIAQLGRYSLIDFSIITNRNYKPTWFHEIIASKLEAVERGEIKRLMIFMPPRNGKSLLATINFPAWYLGRNPEKEIITASYSGELAQNFGGKTRDLVDGEIYKLIFNVQLKSDEQSKAKWCTNKGGSYTSVGIGGAITGRGANVLLIDDPIKNREEASSEVIRNKHWDWYTSTAYTRLEKDGTIILILTRWHIDDLAGRLLKKQQEGGEKWEVIRFPAIAEVDDQYRKEGEPLWSDKYNLGALDQIKQTIGPYDWSALYQQTPIMSELQEFKPAWYHYRTRVEIEKLNTRNFLTIDTAMSKADSADYCGFCENYVDKENKWNIAGYRIRFNAKELVDYMFTLHEKRNFEKIGIEKTAYTWGLKPFIDEEMRKRGKFLPIVELEHKQISKEIRIRGLIPRYSSGSVYHLEGECRDLEGEQASFPQSVHDDATDAEAYQLQIAQKPDYDAYVPNLNTWEAISKYEG